MATAIITDDKINSEFKIKQIDEPLNRSILHFAVEKEQSDIARVKLLLSNKSNRHVQWLLKFTDNAITAEPMMFGRIEKFGSDEVNLIWQRPNAINNWTDAPNPKMQLYMKLINVESGKEVHNAFTKFKAMINPDAECSVNDLPVHEVVIKSESISEQEITDENESKSDLDNATINLENFLDDPDTLFWLIVILSCFFAAVILQSISDNNR